MWEWEEEGWQEEGIVIVEVVESGSLVQNRGCKWVP